MALEPPSRQEAANLPPDDEAQGIYQPPGGYTSPPPSGTETGTGNAGPIPPPPPPITQSSGYQGPVDDRGFPTRYDYANEPWRESGTGVADQPLTQTYIATVTRPSDGLFESQMPRANWGRTWMGVGIATVATFLSTLITVYLFPAILPQLYNADSFATQLQRGGASGLNQQTIDTLTNWFRFSSGAGALVLALLTPITFILGALILYASSKIFGGRGVDFGIHAYLLSLSYTPVKVLIAVVGLLPLVGGLVAFALQLYQYYLAGMAMRASQKMNSGRAMAAAYVPFLLEIVLFIVAICVLVFTLIGSINLNR